MKRNNQFQLEDKPCPCCNARNDNIILQGHDSLYDLPGTFNVVKCNKCGLLRTNPRPTPESIQFYYPDFYSPYQSSNQNTYTENKGKKIMFWKTILKQFIAFNTTNIPPIKKGHMLEIGCASGSYLKRMSNEGWKVTGIETNMKCAQNLLDAGYTIYNSTLENMPDPKEKFDLITAWMVFEHLHNPLLCLNKAYKWSKQNACLVMSVPNAKAIEFQLFKDNWYDLHLPCHLYHYTPETITRLLNKGGWKVYKIYHQRVLDTLIGSMGIYLKNVQKLPSMSKKLIHFSENSVKMGIRLLYPPAYLLSLFGQTSRMTIWARKKT